MEKESEKNGKPNQRRESSTESDESDDSLSDFIPTPPDGGWGWVVVFSSLMCNIIVDGIGYSFGIFLPEFVMFFGETRSKVSLVGSLLCGTYLCAGPVVSGLTNKFGCRPVTIAGSIFATIAFVLATFSPNIDILIITYGVMGGLGFGMIYLPSIVSVGYYFEKKRAIATGIAVCGSGIGTFIFSPLTKKLLDEFDWTNALFILAGIVFNGCVCGMLMRPLEPKKKTKRKTKEKPREKNMIDRIKETKRKRYGPSESSGIGPTDTTDILEKVQQAKLKREERIQENESEVGSLPSTYFEKSILRTDSTSSKKHPRVQKLSFSERGENRSNPDTPLTPPQVTVTEAGIGQSVSTTLIPSDIQSDQGSIGSPPSSPLKSPDGDHPLLQKKRHSEESHGSSPRERTSSYSNHPALKGLHIREVQPLIRVENGGIKKHAKSGRDELLARTAAGSRTHFGSARSISSKDYSRPMYRQDIFYSGSVLNIPQYRSQPDMNSYITSITTIPGADYDEPECKCLKLVPCLPKPVKDVLSEMLDVSLLTHWGFLCICLGNIFSMMGFYVPYVYLVDKAMLMGMDKTQASFLLSVIGITNTIGRVLSGVLADVFKNIPSLMINNVAMLIAGLAILLTPFCQDYVTMCIAASVFGLCTAAFISLSSIILCDLLGLAKLTNAFGLMSMARGIAGVVGPPIAGAVFQATGNYDASFFLGGGLFLMGTMLHFILYLPCMRENKKEEELDIEIGDDDNDGTEMKNLNAKSLGSNGVVKPVDV